VTGLYLLEPEAPGAAWAPFTGVRPIAELRAGIWRVRERWEAAAGQDATAILGGHATGFSEGDEPPIRAPGPVDGPAIIGAAWFAPTGVPLAPGTAPLTSSGQAARRLTHREETVGWIVPEGDRWTGPHDNGPAVEIDGVRLRGTYDLLTALENLLPADCTDFLVAPNEGVPEGSVVLGDPAQVISLGAVVEPGVVFDVRQGAVVIDQGSEIRSGTRLEGPTYIGSGTKVLGGFIRGSVVGPECRVRGEIALSVFLGFANKSHYGFVGHSVVGHWVNLGAGTTTSNLKNTYGPVRLEVDGERIETGRINVGTLFGDHAKTAIGTMLATGTIVSAGANVFGMPTPPKYLPPFAWGCTGERMTEDGFLRVAERVMVRRNVEFSSARRESLRLAIQRSARR
jgi:UDP-N-acetylglucosamine diphosphorylase / glucose-1-phosphate thymidylyltransferase / UDP-N-acetylgalactosamine diphosphorylase / glucosamine-1-phosphate N-acetyltransferase / galactosamine-1-phosphate N-acetyltransferase